MVLFLAILSAGIGSLYTAYFMYKPAVNNNATSIIIPEVSVLPTYNSAEDNNNVCCICLENTRTHMASPCNHRSYCYNCIQKISRCSISCRKAIIALNVSIELCAVCLIPSRKNLSHCARSLCVRTWVKLS